MNRTSTSNDPRLSRRTFMVATGAVGAGVGLLSSAGVALAAPSASGDLQIAKVAASLEVLAVSTYKAALDAATAGKLGAVPAAVATYVQTAITDHQYALDQWNGVITGAGSPAVSAPPSDLNAKVQQAFGGVTDVVGAAKLALLLEEVAAQTYFGATTQLLSAAAITLAGNFIIIDQQHQSILLFVLGQYPVPEVFMDDSMAYAPPGSPPVPPLPVGPVPGSPIPAVKPPIMISP